MKRQLFTFLLSILCGSIYSQDPIFNWANASHGSFPKHGKSISTDTYGNVYTLGNYKGTVDFDPGPGVFNLTAHTYLTNLRTDLFLQKLDRHGNFIWAITIPTVLTQQNYTAADLTIDASNNIIITGNFADFDTVDFDPGSGIFNVNTPGPGSVGIFVLKLNSKGSFIWAKAFGGLWYPSNAYSITCDRQDNILLTGTFQSTYYFDSDTTKHVLNSKWSIPPSTPNHTKDIFITKLDRATGKTLWAKSIGSSREDKGLSITTDSLSNVITTGYFGDTADFDPGPGTFLIDSKQYSVFIQKLDSSGNFVWAKALDGAGNDYGNSITTDHQGNFILTGKYQQATDFDPGNQVYQLTSNGSLHDIFILKIDFNGDFLWAKSIGNNGSDAGSSVAVDASGNIYVTGNYKAEVDFDPGSGTFTLPKYLDASIFLLKLAPLGNFKWAGALLTARGEGNSIHVDPFGNILTTGIGRGSIVDFDPGPGTNKINIGPEEYYNLKLGQCILDTSLSITSSNLTSNQKRVSYQWLDCGKIFSKLIGDTLRTFNPRKVGNYAVEITVNNCKDTSSCVSFNWPLSRKHKLGNSPLENVSLYPNPTSITLNIFSNDNWELSYTLLDLNGRQMLFGKFSKQVQLDVSVLKSGLYFLKIRNGENGLIETRRIIVGM